MIVPMKKISLIMLASQKEQALKTLRRMGLVHIQITEGAGERLQQINRQIALLENAVFTVTEKTKKDTAQQELSTEEALAAAQRVTDLTEEVKTCQAEKAALETELDRLKAWGELDPAWLAKLREKGVPLTVCEVPVSSYEALEAQTILVSKTKTVVRCLMVGEAAGEYAVTLPRESTGEMKAKIEALRKRLLSLSEEIAACAGYAQSMKKAMAALEKELEFETYSTGMTDAALGEGPQVAYFQGYLPAEDLNKLQAAARENAWGLLAQDPTEEDDVPTKLQNNKFVSLIYPLTDFLGTVPGYFEYDISGWFLGFILVFFGIIFGDGGYGLLICTVALLPILKALKEKKPVPPTFLLVGLLGLATVLWGTVTCTWFGLAPEQLPGWLKALSVPVISNVNADKIWYPPWTNGQAGLTTAQNIQIFCFSLALVQLTVAHIKGAVRNRKSLKILGDIGSVFQLMGIYYVVLALVVNGAVFPMGLVIAGIPVGTAAIGLIGVGFVMSFVFANYEGSIGRSVLESLKNIVSVLLGVVNVFSDIVSYIRLWAVGLAGAAISATVNELAGPLLGNFLFIVVAIVLLVFGHGLNMILNILSVIVHGIRLNTLEFSSHLDMSWSGHKYKPFEE